MTGPVSGCARRDSEPTSSLNSIDTILKLFDTTLQLLVSFVAVSTVDCRVEDPLRTLLIEIFRSGTEPNLLVVVPCPA